MFPVLDRVEFLHTSYMKRELITDNDSFIQNFFRLFALNNFNDTDFRPDSLLQETLKSIAAITNIERAILYLNQRNRDDLYRAAAVGFNDQELNALSAIPLPQRPEYRAVTERQELKIADLSRYSAVYEQIAKEFAVHSSLNFPILSGSGAPAGVLCLYFSKPLKLSAEKTELIRLYLMIVAQSIEKFDEYRGLKAENEHLKRANEKLEMQVTKIEERRRALVHIMSDMKDLNQRLSDQRKAMLHILVDYEKDRTRMTKQTERLDNSRRALIHILQDQQESNRRLENSRKAMIHIMDDLRNTTEEMLRREQELRDKQEQLIQAGKLATLGELTTGIAHELNNPLNNIALFVGNAIDHIQLGVAKKKRVLQDLNSAKQQLRKATEIISHLRTFGRAATVSREAISLGEIVQRSISLIQEQLRLRQIEISVSCPTDLLVFANPIQLEQVFINILTNARDALDNSREKKILIECKAGDELVNITIRDTGPGIPKGLEKRIFDPFFTTKEVGEGTGLGLSITYGIIQEHSGSIHVENRPGQGATFVIQLPLHKKESVQTENNVVGKDSQARS